MIFSKTFKEAISHLPSKEKDKLILRLLKKNLGLANRLHFELVSTTTVDEQREKVKKSIISKAKRTAETFYSVGYLNMDVRYLSGEINEHVSITKDKFGEVQLNLVMINTVLENNTENILSVTPAKARKFCVAVIARAFKILLLIKKLDEDYFIEFEEDLVTFGKHIEGNNYLMDIAIKHGFDVNWLLIPEIPNDIAQVYRNLRNQGFLK